MPARRRMTVRDFVLLLRTAADDWRADYASSMGAALSYYAVFSVTPLLLILVSIAGLVYGADAARGELFEQLHGMMGDAAASALQGLLANTHRPQQGIVAATVGLLVLLVGASSVFGELQSALDRIWRVPQTQGGVKLLLHNRLKAFGLIFGAGVLLLLSLMASAALEIVATWWRDWFGGWEGAARALNAALSFVLVAILFAMIYKMLPRVRIAWSDVRIGAVVTALLFTIGKHLIALYLGRTGVTSPFGAAGSLVAVLVWVYYSAQIFLYGAEFTWAYAHRFGSLRKT
jgi:membrane protein